MDHKLNEIKEEISADAIKTEEDNTVEIKMEENKIEEMKTEKIKIAESRAVNNKEMKTKLEQKLFPLGTIIILEGGVKKIMVIARGIATNMEEGVKYFDYGACLYPEGVIGDQLLYFNQGDINKIIALGYKDEDDNIVLENLEKWKEKTGYKKGEILELNLQKKGE